MSSRGLRLMLQVAPARHGMTSEAIVRTLGGRKTGRGWMTRCPAHDDREPSLSIRNADDGKLLLHCHAGCDQRRVIAALRSLGLWDENSQRRFRRPVSSRIADD